MGVGDVVLGVAACFFILLILSAFAQSSYDAFAKEAQQKGFNIIKVEHIELNMTGALVYEVSDNSTIFFEKVAQLNTSTIYWDTTSGNGLLFVAKNETVAYDYVP